MRFAVLVLAGCGRIGFETGIAGSDAPADSTPCVFGAFGAPQPVVELQTTQLEWAPSISRDAKTMIFSRQVPATGQDLFIATRVSVTAPWRDIHSIAELVTTAGEDDPTQAFDDELILGDGSLLRSVRNGNRFDAPTEFFDDTRFAVLEGPELTADGLSLYYNAALPGGESQLFLATRPSREAPFTGFDKLDPSPDPTGDAGWSTISSDELELFFSSDHGGERDIWTSRRATKTDPFPPATHVDELSSASAEDYDPELSFDGTTIWFASNRIAGNDHDIFVATRSCE